MKMTNHYERKPFIAPSGYKTRNDAMSFLGISNGTIYKWEKRGLLHPIRMGSYCLYPEGELKELKKTKG